MVGLLGLLIAGITRRGDRLQGKLEQAESQANSANARLFEVESKARAQLDEMLQQIRGDTRNSEQVSTRMQAIVRQVDALGETQTGSSGPVENQVALFVALVEDFAAMVNEDDPIVRELLAAWRDDKYGHSATAWRSALAALRSRALSAGVVEATEIQF